MLHRFLTGEGEEIEELDTDQFIHETDKITLINQVWLITSMVRPQKDMNRITFVPVRVKPLKEWDLPKE